MRLLSLPTRATPCSRNRKPPNKRLKLAGGRRFKGNGVLCPGGHELSFNYAAPRARRPQLKRDPLGSPLDADDALTTHCHPSWDWRFPRSVYGLDRAEAVAPRSGSLFTDGL